MNRIAKTLIAGAAIVAATASAAYAFGPGRGQGFGPCGGGQAGFSDGMPGPMMGGGWGGRGGWGGQNIDRQLTADDVRAIVTGRLAMSGNKRLKVGQVQEKDADTVTAEIVTVDNSLVRRMEVNRHTGRSTPVQ